MAFREFIGLPLLESRSLFLSYSIRNTAKRFVTSDVAGHLNSGDDVSLSFFYEIVLIKRRQPSSFLFHGTFYKNVLLYLTAEYSRFDSKN